MAFLTQISGSAAAFIPRRRDLESLRRAAHGCRGCPLYEHATQTVFGSGSAQARLMLVGEQPGDHEDLEGKPFVGPAGLLDGCLTEAGIEREDAYITNAVKHFKWEPRGKRRIHKKPGGREIEACRPWLDAELEEIQPEILICLGATAAQALLGKSFRITRDRGRVLHQVGLPPILATVHPSSILRSPDAQGRHETRALFVRDLKRAAVYLRSHRRAA